MVRDELSWKNLEIESSEDREFRWVLKTGQVRRM